MLRGLVLASCTAADIVFTLIVVNGSEVLRARDAAWSLSGPGEAPTLANVAFVRGRLRLWVQTDVLVEGIRLQRWDKALLLHAHLVLLHRTRGSMIHAARIHAIDVLEQVANHRLPQIRYSFILHHVEGHGREHLATLTIVLRITL